LYKILAETASANEPSVKECVLQTTAKKCNALIAAGHAAAIAIVIVIVNARNGYFGFTPRERCRSLLQNPE
jgi:hypothetical protein